MEYSSNRTPDTNAGVAQVWHHITDQIAPGNVQKTAAAHIAQNIHVEEKGTQIDDIPRPLSTVAKMAEEALAFHVEGMLEDGTEVPEPSDMEKALEQAEPYQLAFLSIPLEDPKDAIIRVNVTLPKTTLDKVDVFAKYTGMTRSGFLAMASEAYITIWKHEGPSAFERYSGKSKTGAASLSGRYLRHAKKKTKA